MPPRFPSFKKLELSDAPDIRRLTSRYAPFSDFNFGSLWSWDVKGRVKISQSDENLVVRFEQFETDLPFYSFIGHRALRKTAAALIEMSQNEGLEPRLDLVPESVARHLESGTFRCEEDLDEADYVLSV